MANIKFTALTEITTMAVGDILAIVSDPAGTPVSKKITKANLFTAPIFATSITGSYLTASELLGSDSNKNIVSLPVATYPSLTELTYLKGVTSAIQTQLNGKQASGSYGLTTNPLSQFATTTSAQLAGVISDETGSGALVFATSPTLVTPILGVATGTSLALAMTQSTTTPSPFLVQSVIGTYSGSSTIVEMHPLVIQSVISGTGTVTNLHTLEVETPTKSSTGVATTITGVRIENQGMAGATTSMGLHILPQSGSTNNYSAIFEGGNVGIGTTAPGAKLVVAKDTNPANQSSLGSIAIFASDNPGALAQVAFVGADATVGGPLFNGYKARGTCASPTPALADDYALGISGYYWDTSIATDWKFGSAITFYREAGTGSQFRVPGYIKFKTSQASDDTIYERMRLDSLGRLGIGVTNPTSFLHLKAGTATASTAPLKFTSGTLNTTAEAGAVEFLTDDFYATITTGAARKKFVLDNGTALTSGRIPFATTNGRLTDDADLTFATDTLTATKIVGTTSIKVGTVAGYISSDGSTGATGTFTTVDSKTVTVKDGIIVSII